MVNRDRRGEHGHESASITILGSKGTGSVAAPQPWFAELLGPSPNRDGEPNDALEPGGPRPYARAAVRLLKSVGALFHSTHFRFSPRVRPVGCFSR